MPGNASPVSPREFDPYAKQLPVRPEPAKHRPVAGPGGGERFGAEYCSIEVHDGSGVQVLVGIDAPDDLGALSDRVRHLRLLCLW